MTALIAFIAGTAAMLSAEGDSSRAWEEALRGVDSRIFPEAEARQRAASLEDRIQAAIAQANRRESSLWRQVKSREDWERYREPRIAALRDSLGSPPPQSGAAPRSIVTRAISGDGYRIENLVFETRPGLVVTANLYLPALPPAKPFPAIVLSHSHHHPKEEGELQDMGISWARAGCAVLVPDQLGHGERRQHPFAGERSYPRPFRAGRQDYYFRYITGIQLHLAGESLMGWMAADLRRAVDLLLSRPDVDPARVILLGSVAGGGDPAAVAAALDSRVAASVPFNFGGPQPETRYPLPDDSEESFNYAGGGSWESTRNLRLSAGEGFLPWTIVGATAPRALVYAHEFSWDRERDPAWRRLERIYGFYGAAERLAFAHGRGALSGRPPEATHCNNIGAEHRRFIHEAFQRWFGIAAPPAGPYPRRSPDELRCLTPEAAAALRPRLLHEILLDLGRERAGAARQALERLSPEARLAELRSRWGKLLGAGAGEVRSPRVLERRSEPFGGGALERVALETEDGVAVPLLLFLPARAAQGPVPAVVGFAQGGKARFLERRRVALAALLAGGAAICLPDLRGTGETGLPGDARDRRGAATEISSSYLMLGRTLLGSRLGDLRSVLAFLRGDPRFDASRLAVWGDSFALVNPPERTLAVPLEADPFPDLAEPLGGTLAVLAGLFEADLRAVYGSGGLSSYLSLLESPFCYVPHDVVVPGAIPAGDLPAAAAAHSPQKTLLEGEVDGLNRLSGQAASGDTRLAGWILSRLAK